MKVKSASKSRNMLDRVEFQKLVRHLESLPKPVVGTYQTLASAAAIALNLPVSPSAVKDALVAAEIPHSTRTPTQRSGIDRVVRLANLVEALAIFINNEVGELPEGLIDGIHAIATSKSSPEKGQSKP